jgi:pimeloyl-ACP methyl ester carboxylesterase
MSNKIRANGIEINYVEAGKGEPLLVLHAGFMSTSSIWADHPGAYGSRINMLSDRFRVIAPDSRGHGTTANASPDPISYDQLADDVIALVAALDLHRPMICGFSHGGMIATIAAIKSPASFRAVVNDAGFDLLDPASPSFAMMRQMLGGSPTATAANPVVVQNVFSMPQMGGFFEKMSADHGGNWKTLATRAFACLTTPIGYTFDDLRKITAPTLILTGDRDICCSVEDAVRAFRALAKGELAILPGAGHMLPDAAIHATAEFLARHHA